MHALITNFKIEFSLMKHIAIHTHRAVIFCDAPVQKSFVMSKNPKRSLQNVKQESVHSLRFTLSPLISGEALLFTETLRL